MSSRINSPNHCQICLESFNDACINCQASTDNNDPHCYSHTTSCGHHFHHHCIQRWWRYTRQRICALCNQTQPLNTPSTAAM
jgi:hypothetical protein